MPDSKETAFITVEATTLRRLFTGAVGLKLPWFQRAYAWEIEQAGCLLNDLLRAAENATKGYALGTMRLARPDGEIVASLVDGHQRSITLTIIFAILRDLLAGEAPQEAERLNRLIFMSDDNGRAALDRPFFTPQPNVADFFSRYVQQPGGTLTEPDRALANYGNCNRNVLENRNKLVDQLAELDPGHRRALAEFALDRCWVIVTTVEDEDEAWAMLVNEEESGLKFHASERSKISLISVMPNADQPAAGEIWEYWQSQCGSDGITELVQHLRTLNARRRSRRPIEHDLIERFRLDRGGLGFMNEVFAPHAERLVAIKQRTIGSPAGRDATGRRLDYLTWLDTNYWTPPLLQLLSLQATTHPDVDHFVHRLDRLGWALKLSGADTAEQELRFNRVLREMNKTASIDEIDALRIEHKLARTAAARLREKNFYLKTCCGLVLRRLSAIAGQFHGAVDGVHVTVEHVLPRNPAEKSRWRAGHSLAVLEAQANRLGNLLLLTQKENVAAGASDYDVKRPILLATNFKITRDAAEAENTWTGATIERRTEAMIAMLFADLDLAL